MDFARQIGIVFAVMLFFGSALWLLQRGGKVRFSGRMFPSKSPRQIQVIERLSLTPQHMLCLVRIGERTVLIGTAPTSCQLLESAVTMSQPSPQTGVQA